MAVVWPDDDLDQARSYLVEGRLGDFFTESLGWDESDLGDSSFQTVKVDDPLVPSGVLNVECVAAQSGIPVWVCRVDRIPSNTSQLEVDRTLRALSMHRLCIFVQGGVGFTPRQVWRWPSASSSRLTRHELLVTDEAQIEALLERCALLYLTSDDIANGVSILGLLDRMRRGFDVETVNETRVASNQMAGLFESLAKAGMSEAQISTVMARLLFLLFADDTQMWSESEDSNSFERMIRGTHQEGTDLAQRLNELFDLLNTKPSGASAVADAPEYLSGFKYVNGGMFADVVPLPAEMSGAVAKTFRQQLLATSERDWSKVSPAIFGSMFQSVRDAKTRREMGEHYTSEEDVLKTLNPLFLDELWDKLTNAVDKSDEPTRLRNLRRELANIRFMDPACGCGNFIIIAYREMRKLELDILVRLRNLGQIDESELGSLVVGTAGVSEGVRKRARSIEPLVTIDNFYGLELDPWPASIARTAMFLVERQMDQKMMEEFGYAPVRLPLAHSAHILEGDALTEVDPASGEQVDRDWSKVLPVTAQDVVDGVRVYIAGNPPFVGQAKKGDAQDQGMRLAWGDDYAGYLDFATAWFAKAARYLKTLQEQAETPDAKVVPGDFAFVSTNSIVQGQPVPSLFGPLFRDGWRLKFAYRTFPWESEATGKAAVHCVITGFTRSKVSERSRTVRVFDYDWSTRRTVEQEPVHALNAYLVEGPNVLVEKRSTPLSSQLPLTYFGSKPVDGGNLIVEVEDYPTVTADPVATRYLRPFRMGKELVRGLDRWCLWLEDASEEEIASSPVLNARVEANRGWRSSQPQKGDAYKLRDIPHLMRPNKARPLEPYVGIPRVVSDNRPYYTVKPLSPEVIAGDKVYTAIDPDGFLFAVISSSMFITWQRAVGGRLKSDLSFSNTVVWNNLPLPQISEEQRRKVIAAGRKVLAAREAIEEHAGEPVSLAEMYASLATMDPALRAAHDELDSAVDVAFGASRRCSSDAKRLEILFERYQELTAAEETAKPAKKPRARRRTAK
ncbi:DNA methyltransferase [Rothia mucilaginosa]|uniref:class I SAM-dependent DNA methyltransferase n=1 Tax=Rothia mucilaginosa TaxID=43675 RepID=UPI0028D4B9CC|nr:DNA methyltransferase [Rothia mucilaginosa]